MRIVAVQHDIVWCDRAANFARLAPMVASAAAAGGDLVLLSETFPTGFATDRDDLGEAPDGPSSSWLQQMAREHGVWIGGTYAELGDDGDQHPYNTFVLTGPDGTQHRYRKQHRFVFGGEDRIFRAGDQSVTVEVDGVRLSLFVCYDLRFADAMWAVAPQTDVYLVPACWPESRRLHWQTLLRARAIEDQAYVVGCNRVGTGGPLSYAGDSAVIDPLGEVLATASGVETLVIADVDPAHVRDVRARFPFLQDR
jgi:predicted amidohydrolase